MAGFSITDEIKRRIEKENRLSALGVKQLMDGSIITSADDRKQVLMLIIYLYGKVDSCLKPAPPIHVTSHFK